MDAALPPDDVTNLLGRWGTGTPAEQERIVAAVEGELRRIAAAYLQRERAGHALQPTALVNEAYLRLVNQRNVPSEVRAHFGRLTEQEVARAKQISPATVRREVAAAKFWLGRHMKGER